MANTSINLVNLDFEAIKSSLKTHLASQSRFKDYNFDGSNLSVLLDLLSYNTYLNSFYLNMVASEMFLDTAQIRDSIVSHAKELNYLPRSFRSAQANVNIRITPSPAVSSVVIPSKTSFTSRLGSNTYNFVTNQSYALTTSNNGAFIANNVVLYEGYYITDTFVKNDSIENQRFVLNNPNIDTTSLEVEVSENSGANVYTYTQAYSLFGLSSNSQVFFIQPAENEQYEVIFGDNLSGRTPRNSSVIDISYRVCNGELPNGADNFINNSSIDGHSNVSVVLNASAINGAISESNTSIKFNAPRSFQAQERAITESDYEVLLTREFPEIQAISVYGGEKENPPQYGKVFIAIDISNSEGVPDINKQIYKNYLSDKVPLGIVPEIVTPSFVYLSVDTTVNYNYNTTVLPESQLTTKVLVAITRYNDENLNNFNAKFRYSNFVSTIDSCDPSILNNDTFVTPYYLLTLQSGVSSSFSFSYNAPILITSPTETTHPVASEKGMISSAFVKNGLTCQLEDDGIGNIRIVRVTSVNHVEVEKVGAIDYSTGDVVISNLLVESYTGSGIKLYAKTVSRDYKTTLKNILTIKPEDISVRMAPVKS